MSAESGPDDPESGESALGLGTIDVESLFDDEEQGRILEAATARAESPELFVRDAILERVADAIGEDGHLECWVDECEETFTTERRRRGHVGRAHSDNLPEGDFWCGICGFGPTTYPGVGAHHGHRHDHEVVRPLDHEPDPGELLSPDDVPDHMNRELLERLYEEHDGSITEVCRAHDFEVTRGRVRHYLIDFGIHEPTPQTGKTSVEDGQPKYRDPEWLRPRYQAADGNISEMHRRLQEQGEDVAYRTLNTWLKRTGIHNPRDPPGRRHGEGGPPPSTSTGTEEEGDSEGRKTDPGESDTAHKPVDVPEDEQAFVLDEFPWPPNGGTYHGDEECWTLSRSDSDRDVVPLPWSRSELNENDEWTGCGHCTDTTGDVEQDSTTEPSEPSTIPPAPDVSAEAVEEARRQYDEREAEKALAEGDDVDEAADDDSPTEMDSSPLAERVESLDLSDPVDLEAAFDAADGNIQALSDASDLSYSTVRSRLIANDIHEPATEAWSSAIRGPLEKLDVDDPDAVEGFHDLAMPDWLDEGTFYAAVDVADDVSELRMALDWGTVELLAEVVELLDLDVDVPGGGS